MALVLSPNLWKSMQSGFTEQKNKKKNMQCLLDMSKFSATTALFEGGPKY